jgi:nitrogenase-stabilizing/protective protein
VAYLGPEAQYQACRGLLMRAYEDFIRSTPAQERVFKVFQDAEGARVGLDRLRSTLPSRNAS